MKSLFIISVPRSASTALEEACSKGLPTFEAKGEILNAGKSINKIKVPQYGKKEKNYARMQEECSKHVEYSIIRDVVQPFFISDNIEWIKERFNVLMIVRPVKEIMVSRRRLGWKMPRKAVARYQEMLIDLINGEEVKRIDYHEFVNDPDVLIQILKNWYNCQTFEYMTGSFLAKKKRTFIDLLQNGVKPKKYQKRD